LGRTDGGQLDRVAVKQNWRRQEELALYPELVLLGRPPAGCFLGDVVAAGDVPLDQRKDRRAIAGRG
jgi:hypothetical protein